MGQIAVSGADEAQRYHLAPADVARVYSRAAPGYDEAAVLAGRVRDQLLDRLDVVAMRPKAVLDAGVGTGAALAPLRERFADARLLGVDLAEGMLAVARQRAAAAGDARCLRADCHALPLADGSVDMVFSNLMLASCHDTETVLREFRRVLAPQGLLTFSTFGPDTLKELRAAWAQVDRHVHVHYFYDMHDIGDALQRAGFAGPVMDVDHYTLTYATLTDMLRDLRAIGAGNVAAGRSRGLTGRRRLARLQSAYEPHRRDGRLPATFEVVFGHAWAPAGPAQRRLDEGVVAVPAGGIGRVSRS